MQNQEIQQSEERKSRPKWNKEYVIFLVLPIVLTILFPLGGLFYLSGRFSPYGILLANVCMLYFGICAFIIYCFFSGIVRLFVNWIKNKWKKKVVHIAEIIIPIVFIALLIIPFFIPIESDLSWPWFKIFMYGFRERIRIKADIPVIRHWLKTLNKEDCTDRAIRLHSDKWPKSLKVLNSYRVHVYADENGNPKVRLMWGSGFLGHWGVVIGMEDMKIPPSDFSRFGEYRLPVEPGVYVWHEIQ